MRSENKDLCVMFFLQVEKANWSSTKALAAFKYLWELGFGIP